MARPAVPAAVRFWSKVDISSGCWIWTAGLSSGGYGKFFDGARPVGAHRWAWEHVNGPVPTGLVLDHLCRQRRCVRPSHLEPCTNLENVRRGHSGRYNRSKTHCPAGHLYSPENCGVQRGGGRYCRACARHRMKRSFVPPATGRPEFCPHGHPYDEANTGIQATGHRWCKACNRIRSAAVRLKRKAS